MAHRKGVNGPLEAVECYGDNRPARRLGVSLALFFEQHVVWQCAGPGRAGLKRVSFTCLIRTGRGFMRVAEVRLQAGESLENALRRFKRKVQEENIIGEVRRHSYYLKLGEKRRLKQALARKRARKKFRKDSD